MSARKPGYMYIWEYRVRPGCEAAFEEAYGPGGPWVTLFRQASGYQRTELHRDLEDPQRYLTIDYWDSRQAFQEFRSRMAAEFETIDSGCEELTLDEREAGHWRLIC